MVKFSIHIYLILKIFTFAMNEVMLNLIEDLLVDERKCITTQKFT